MDRPPHPRRRRAASEPPGEHSGLSVGTSASRPLVQPIASVERETSSQSAASTRHRPHQRTPPRTPPHSPPRGGIDAGQFMQQFLDSLAQIAGHGATAGRTMGDPFIIAHRDFSRLHTPRFDRRGTYVAADAWLTSVEKTLCLARSPTEFHTELATTLFDGDAEYWWATQQPQYEGGLRERHVASAYGT